MKAFLKGLFCLLILQGFSSCEKSPHSPDHSPVLLSDINVNDPENKFNLQYFKGKVSIHTTLSESILVLSNIKESSTGDFEDRIFVLQQDTSQKKKAIEEINEKVNEKAEILFFKVGLLLSLQSGENYLLALGREQKMEENVLAFLANFNAAPFLKNTIQGYGLAAMKKPFSSVEDFFNQHTVTFYHTDEEMKKILGVSDITFRYIPPPCSDCSLIKSCKCGGFGSTSCSCDGGSVSCVSGCNACCSAGIAKCCDEGTTPD